MKCNSQNSPTEKCPSQQSLVHRQLGDHHHRLTPERFHQPQKKLHGHLYLWQPGIGSLPILDIPADRWPFVPGSSDSTCCYQGPSQFMSFMLWKDRGRTTWFWFRVYATRTGRLHTSLRRSSRQARSPSVTTPQYYGITDYPPCAVTFHIFTSS